MSDTPQMTTPAPGSAPSAAASSEQAPALPSGVVHELPADLVEALLAEPETAELWRGLTPLGRNEFVCWVEDAKKPKTRARRIRRTGEEMHEGKRRPCCWPGCEHRERTGR